MFWDPSRSTDAVEEERASNARRQGRPKHRALAFSAVTLAAMLAIPFVGAHAASPTLSVSGTAVPKALIVVAGGGFSPNVVVGLRWDGSARNMPTVASDGSGSFRASLQIPAWVKPGTHVLSAAYVSALKLNPPSSAASDVASLNVTVSAAGASDTPAPSTTPSATASPTATPSPTSTVAPTPTPTPTPTPSPTPSQKVVSFGPSQSQSTFVALARDLSVDVIELQSGTYRGWHLWLNIDRTSNPLTVRPAAGATVVFDGGGSSDGLMYLGFPSTVPPATGGKTAYITFSGFQITNYDPSSTGIVTTAWVDHVAINNVVVTNIHGAHGTANQTDHVIYVAGDGGYSGSVAHQAQALTLNNWNVTSDGSVNGLHIYHPDGGLPNGITALNWIFRGNGAQWAAIGRPGATNVTIDGWSITGTRVPVDFEGPSGVVRNTHATSSGSPIILSPMVAGSGNSWG